MSPTNKKKLTPLIITEVLIILTIIVLLNIYHDIQIQRLIWVTCIVSAIVSIFIIYIDNKGYWQNLGIIVGFGITIIGWFFNSYFNNEAVARQNEFNNEGAIKNSQRELKVKYLLDAYIKILSCADRDSEPSLNTFIYYKNIESSIGIASLLGDSELIKKVNEFAHDSTLDGKQYDSHYLSVLYELRQELRQELGLPLLFNGRGEGISDYDITFYRRYIRSSTMKLDPQYYTNLEIKLAKELTNSNFNH